jgi:amidohydrolase
MDFSNFDQKFSDWLINIRRTIHQNPELSWEEYETTNFIFEVLTQIGITKIERPLKTGLIAIIEGQNPTKKCIALRADIDALPINQTNEVSYKSKNAGKMHACGHDVHSTCVLGAAKWLYENKDKWQGTIKLIFQPSEEKQPSGAEAMIQAKCLENPKVESIIGLHVTPELAVGKLGFRSGMFMASADEIYLKIIGKGGHGASPHLCIDPIVISANIIIQLQQLVSRYANPITPTVLTFGDIQGHGATNIIPDSVVLKGTLRTFDESWRATLKEKIKAICNNTASSFGATCEIEMPDGLAFVYNDPILTDNLKACATSFLGNENVVEMPIRMGAEDFSAYGKHSKSTFFRLGTGGSEAKTTFTVHNSNFNIDEKALSVGAFSMIQFSLKLLEIK